MTSSIDTIGWEVKPPDVEPETIVVPGAHVNVGFGLAWGCTWVPMPADERSGLKFTRSGSAATS